MKSIYLLIQSALTAAGAYLSARFGILFPVLGILVAMMVVDYITGMMASAYEAVTNPTDKNAGISSKRHAPGILKKVSYLCVIAAAMVVDYIILKVAAEIGMVVSLKAFFGLLATVWYLLNELLSILENAGRMDAPIPAWLKKYIVVLKNKIDKGEEEKTDED